MPLNSLRHVLLSSSLPLLCVWLLLPLPQPVEACLCHVIPHFQCPPPPRCCESGYYALDDCGCCLSCAKAELQECGSTRGKCSKGLRCLKTCGKCAHIHAVCRALSYCCTRSYSYIFFIPEACLILGSNPEPCVFPFIYKNQTFNQCTTEDADIGSVWCATEVDQQGVVVEGRWGDCMESCPGARKLSGSA